MAEQRSRSMWSHTSNILAMLYNANRPPKTRALRASNFNPHLVRSPRKSRVSVEDLTRSIVKLAQARLKG
jgi:hypothetical protein